AVGVASPVLTWRNEWEEGSQAASQVQIASSEDGFGSPAYDSGEVANTEGQWDLTGEHTLTQGVPFFWRVRTQDDTGQWSEWSDVQEAVYEPRGTLTIISPPKVEVRRNWVSKPNSKWAVNFTSDATLDFHTEGTGPLGLKNHARVLVTAEDGGGQINFATHSNTNAEIATAPGEVWEF